MTVDGLTLISGVIIGAVGLVLFIYGKKQADMKCALIGIIMAVFPYFVTSALLMWVIAAGCLGGLYALNRFAPQS